MGRPKYRIVEVVPSPDCGNHGRPASRPRVPRLDSPSSYTPTLGSRSPTSDERDSDPHADSPFVDPATPANGSASASAARASPAPSTSSKPSSPYVERSNPMGSGNTQTVASKDPKAVAQAATDMKNVVRRKLTGYVGFANLPNQWHRRSVRKGFNFNVMVVGE